MFVVGWRSFINRTLEICGSGGVSPHFRLICFAKIFFIVVVYHCNAVAQFGWAVKYWNRPGCALISTKSGSDDAGSTHFLFFHTVTVQKLFHFNVSVLHLLLTVGLISYERFEVLGMRWILCIQLQWRTVFYLRAVISGQCISTTLTVCEWGS